MQSMCIKFMSQIKFEITLFAHYMDLEIGGNKKEKKKEKEKF